MRVDGHIRRSISHVLDRLAAVAARPLTTATHAFARFAGAENSKSSMGFANGSTVRPLMPLHGRRRTVRQVVALLCLVVFIWTVPFRHYNWVRSTRIPILGAKPSELHLYFPPIGDSFAPQVPKYNVYKRTHPRTPLFIPFTRNNTMLQQAVLSYIASGWPRNDIVIIDNTGTMDANNRHMLSRTNPFFIDYNLYRRKYGVAIMQTPTLLNFAQLQNYMLRTAIARRWPFYFWSHMDIAVLSGEDLEPYKSFYHRVLDVLDASGVDQYGSLPPTQAQEEGNEQDVGLPDPPSLPSAVLERVEKKVALRRKQKKPSWAIQFFDFDNLALVNTDAWREIGSWDVFIPYYNTDCDAYARLLLHGYTKDEVQAGYIYDVADVVTDPENRFFPADNEGERRKWGLAPDGTEKPGGQRNSPRFQWLKHELQELMDLKNSNENGRNTWQAASSEERRRKPREPWAHDARAFQSAWWATADYGRGMFVKKWATLDCDLVNKTLDDIWLQEYLEVGTPEWEVRVEQEEHWNQVLAEVAIR